MRRAVARRIVFGLLAQIREGRLTVVEDGARHEFGARRARRRSSTSARPALWPHLLHGGRGLAEAYAQGLWDSPDVTAVLRVAARNVNRLDAARRRARARCASRTCAPARRSCATRRARSRKDIEAHYDLGDDLFERMLDPTMMYSCALFDRPGMTLEQASERQARADLRQARPAARPTTCWRSARAGARSPSTPPARAAAA